uniref:Enolase C-terminal domain-containing protein n=1 Tax=Nelumbo nucifera TaxID=4432 RepID=A0A822YEJ1_NELNU|nr:TPA_asm: hypothetical protein HUJ06_009424 [Nelumbo nucifera]
MGALEIIKAAKKSGLNLMIGGMVERLAMGFAGHLASVLECFKFVDLDTPLFLSEDPVVGGYEGTSRNVKLGYIKELIYEEIILFYFILVTMKFY